MGGEMILDDGALDRRAVVAELLRDRGDLLVVTGLGSPTYDVFAAGDHSANLYLWGAMGGAALTALGIALAQPDRPVIAVTGDGEQLMGMGGLVTISVSAPANLSIVVLDNGHFGETGMQPSHTGQGISFTKIADAMGFSTVTEIDDEAGVQAAREAIHQKGAGPKFLTIRISCRDTERVLPARDGSFIKNRFRENLGFMVS